ncbi:MAG: hypothetical protein JW720_06280 [Sedimentisphaerales bacterium]|nr:hypothetical protein [Sedimentisphaerales bacterium]
MSKRARRNRIVAKRRRFRNRALATGTAAAISLGTGISIQKSLAAFTPNAHQLPVTRDADADLLADREEYAIGYQPFEADQNRNGIPDGVELAMRCAAVVADLPEYYPYPPGDPPPDEIYKIGHMLDGLEICDICGAAIHMGGWEIHNPKLNLKFPDPNDPLDATFLPDLALHYMQHGSFDCLGSIHRGRTDIDRLLRVLELRYPHDPNEHLLALDYEVQGVGQLAPDANDHDGDLLADSEELAAAFNLYNPDQDANLVPDGIDFAKQCHQAIDALPIHDPAGGHPEPNQPYKIDYFQRGLELCEICGQHVNMGYWQVVNPKLGLSMDVYDIACHYMSHGSMSYSGLQFDEPHEPFHNGRMKVALLAKILEMPDKCGRLGTIFLPGDSNKDCREDFADFAGFAEKWLASTEPNQPPGSPQIISYTVLPCPPTSPLETLTAPASELRFKVEVQGPYISFSDEISANCCLDRITLEMTLIGSNIKILETEHVTTPCFCICDWPTTAQLGPFEEGTYSLEVYQRTNEEEEQLIGTTQVSIGPN